MHFRTLSLFITWNRKSKGIEIVKLITSIYFKTSNKFKIKYKSYPTTDNY